MSFTALITGASGGLGESFVKILASYPEAVLILTARNEQKLTAMQYEYERSAASARGVQIIPIVCDLSQEGAARFLADAVQDLGLSVDILINNAGFGLGGSFVSQDPKAMEELLAVNIRALTELTRLLLPDMLAKGRGGILQVSSVAACMPGPYLSLYYASKAYVSSLSLALRQEVRNTGVHVSALCPPPTRTNFEKAAGLKHSLMFQVFPPASPDFVAREGLIALAQNKPACYPGLIAKTIHAYSSLLPDSFLAFVSSAINRTR